MTRRKPRANPKHRTRKMTPKQVKYFGNARQKAALKRSRAAKRAAPVHRPRTVSNRRRAKRRSTNPAWIVTLGPAVNPRKKRSTMAATKKRRKARKVTVNRKRRRVVAKNPRHHVVRHRRRTRRSNPKVVVRYRTRKRSNRRRHAVRRNPTIFGARLGSRQSLTMIGGGLTGVVATKFLPTLIPASMAPNLTSSNVGRTAVSLAAALASGWLATKFVSASFGEGVYFGGLMQTASVALNTFLPAVYKTLGIGLGDFVPGQFAVPQNPVRAAIGSGSHMPAAGGSLVRTSSLGRAYAPAY